MAERPEKPLQSCPETGRYKNSGIRPNGLCQKTDGLGSSFRRLSFLYTNTTWEGRNL